MADANGKSIGIFIYHLKRTDRALPDEWAQCVVAGKDEEDVRTIANEEARSEGYVWKDEAKAMIRRIGIAEDGVQGVVLWAPEVKVPEGERGVAGNSIFLLEKSDSADADQWARVVVSAKDEKQARLIVNNDSQPDAQSKSFIWTDGYLASARKIGEATGGIHGVVLWAPEV